MVKKKKNEGPRKTLRKAQEIMYGRDFKKADEAARGGR
jgi:hypothetical protein